MEGKGRGGEKERRLGREGGDWSTKSQESVNVGVRTVQKQRLEEERQVGGGGMQVGYSISGILSAPSCSQSAYLRQ